MKKSIFLILFTFTIFHSAICQNWNWRNKISHDVSIVDFVVKDDLVVVIGRHCGEFELTVSLLDGTEETENCTIFPWSDSHSYVSILNQADGTVQGFIDLGKIRLRRIDFNGERIVLGGSFEDELFINNQTYTSLGDDDIVFLSMDIGGNINWVHTAGSASLDFINDINIDAFNNCYFAGSIGNEVLFDNETFDRGGLVGKINEDGTVGWLLNPTASSFYSQVQIIPDNENNAIITGSYWNDITIGNEMLETGDNGNFYIAKINESGQPVWINRVKGNSQYNGRVVVDTDNNIYMSGSTSHETYLGDSLYSNNGLLLGFVVKYHSDGTVMQFFQDEMGTGVFTDLKLTTENNITITKEVGGENLIPFVILQNIDVYLQEYDSDFNLIREGLPFKIQGEVNSFNGTKIELNNENDVFLTRRFGLGIFDNELTNETLNSFVGKIADFTFITTEELPIPSVNTDDFIGHKDISIFPNPVQDNLELKIEEPNKNLFLSIISVDGKILKTKNINSDFPFIPTDDLSSGIYFLKVEGDDFISTMKFVKM